MVERQAFDMNITICGGGNIAHALAAVLSLTDEVSVMTRQPGLWAHALAYKKGDFDYSQGHALQTITDSPSIVCEASLIIVAVPRFAISDVLKKIKPHLHAGQAVAFIPAPSGLEGIAVELGQEHGVEVIGLQRVPYIARIVEYGHIVTLSDDRAVHKVVVSNPVDEKFWDEFIVTRFGGRVEHLSSFFAFTFSNANPLLHPARLMVLLDKPSYERMPLFYEEWTDESSELYVKSDAEMLAIMRKYPEVDIGRDYESAFDHYGVRSISELTHKIRSIPSFQGIKAPYRLDDLKRYVPDLTSRYFTEDVAYGTVRIKTMAQRVGVATPTIDMFVNRIQLCLSSGSKPKAHE